MLVASYEALKFQRIDLFTVTLRQIGAYIAHQQFKDAVDVLLNGDGNDNPIELVPIDGSEIRYEDLLELVNSLDPYELNTIIAPPQMMIAMLKLDEFKNPQTGINFQVWAKWGTPWRQFYKIQGG